MFDDSSVKLCGGSLHTGLAISEEELNLAGRALAVGLSTAAVSHAMRSVESSLHALALHLQIEFPAPVILQDWMVVTEKIKSEIGKLEKQSRSQEKTERLKLLSELLLPADCFRLAWRNHVSHAREKYEGDEARKVLTNVGEYLKKLSTTLHLPALPS